MSVYPILAASTSNGKCRVTLGDFYLDDVRGISVAIAEDGTTIATLSVPVLRATIASLPAGVYVEPPAGGADPPHMRTFGDAAHA